MEQKNIKDYIWLGLSWRYLQDTPAGRIVHGDDMIIGNLKMLFQYLDEFNLFVTKRAAKDLVELYEQLKATPSNHNITDNEVIKLTTVLRELQNTLRAEALGKIHYILTDKKVEIAKLLDNIGALFASGIYNKLDDISKHDFAEAGKCIAFERSTAAAFHILRATESVLKQLYLKEIKRNRLSVLMWGPMTQALRNKRKPLPTVLLNNLDNIRLNFRNPTQHPEKIYDIQEVQDLLFLCIDVVTRMTRIIHNSA